MGHDQRTYKVARIRTCMDRPIRKCPYWRWSCQVQPNRLLDIGRYLDYIAKYEIPHHPLHAKGYPSIGDAKDTIPIPEDGSTKFVNFKFEGDPVPWLDYASERKGRFVGLANADGSTKTECGIHVDGAERTFDRDLWDSSKSVMNLETQ